MTGSFIYCVYAYIYIVQSYCKGMMIQIEAYHIVWWLHHQPVIHCIRQESLLVKIKVQNPRNRDRFQLFYRFSWCLLRIFPWFPWFPWFSMIFHDFTNQIFHDFFNFFHDFPPSDVRFSWSLFRQEISASFSLCIGDLGGHGHGTLDTKVIPWAGLGMMLGDG